MFDSSTLYYVQLTALFGLTFFIWARGWQYIPYWLTKSPKPITWIDLQTLLHNGQPRGLIHPHIRGTLRLKYETVPSCSIAYFAKLDPTGSLKETVSINMPTRAGIVIELRGRALEQYSVVGGSTRERPRLRSSEKAALDGFMERLRTVAKKAR